MLSNVQLLTNSTIKVAFHTPTNTIIRINDNVHNILEKYVGGVPLDDIASELEIKKEKIAVLIAKLKDALKDKPPVKSTKTAKSIDRITLHVSNDCNLDCTYCYAGGGDYGEEKSLMTKETAKSVIDFFFSHYEYIGSICFFGGEPLMNYAVVQFVCEHITKLYNSNKIKYLPRFVIITNGTILNNKIISLIKTFKISITVSIDGPKEINDHHRIYKNKKGSYDKIKNFINTVKKETSAFIRYEATYTKKHIELGYSVNDISSHLYNTFGISGVIIPEHNDKKNKSIEGKAWEKEFYQNIDSFIKSPNNNDIMVDNVFFEMLHFIANNIKKEFCPVGTKMTAVSVDGYIYPCHMNVGQKHLQLGNIQNDNIVNNFEKFLSKNQYLKLVNKEIAICKTCWVKNLCGGCSITNLFNEQTNKYLTEPQDQYCKKQKQFAETIILKIAEIQKDKKAWGNFIKKLKYQKHTNSTLDCA